MNKKGFLKQFGETVQKLRKQEGLSQEELSEKVGMHRTYIGRIEQGVSNPPIYTVHKIMSALGRKTLEIG